MFSFCLKEAQILAEKSALPGLLAWTLALAGTGPLCCRRWAGLNPARVTVWTRPVDPVPVHTQPGAGQRSWLATLDAQTLMVPPGKEATRLNGKQGQARGGSTSGRLVGRRAAPGRAGAGAAFL